MKVTADTNILVRAITEDDALQSARAQSALAQAETVAIALPALCELAWVLSRAYRIAPTDIADAIRRLINGDNVAVDRPAAEAGLTLLTAGGDFADGVIAYEGERLGADVFVSFDQKAVRLMKRQGQSARLLSPAT